MYENFPTILYEKYGTRDTQNLRIGDLFTFCPQVWGVDNSTTKEADFFVDWLEDTTVAPIAKKTEKGSQFLLLQYWDSAPSTQW